MPTYQYKCPKCGHVYEKLQNINDDSRAKCPKCGTRGERIISGGAGLIFKGSGFYLTDYGRSGQSRSGSEKADTSDKSGGTDKSEKTEKTETTEKAGKPEKTEKPAKTEKADKPKPKPKKGES